MELSINDVDRTKKRSGLGRCKHFFWLGVAFDTVGATVMFTGVFADLLFYDLLLYLGSIIIFLSLLWWVFWYSGNIELSSEEPLNRPYHLPSATTLEVLSQTISNRFSFNMGSVSNTFMRMRPRRRHRKRFLQGSALDMTVAGQVENQLDQDKDGMEGAKESEDAQDFGSEDLPKPEAVKSLKGVCSLGPNAGPLGTEASLPRFVKGPWTHLVQPFTPSPLDQPLTPAILACKSLPIVPVASASQPLPILNSKSQPVVSLASTSQPPAVTLASVSQPAAPLASTSQPLPILTSKSQPVASLASTTQPPVLFASKSLPAVPLSSTSQPLTILTSQSHLLVPVASQSQLQNLAQACQTQPPPLQASQSQGLATQVSLLQLLPTQSFQTQPVDPQVAQAIQHFQAMYHTQQTSQSSSLVQRIGPSQSPSAQEFHREPVAFETPPPAVQELSQNPTDTAYLLPESPAPASQAQQSVPPGRAPTPVPERRSRSL
ncbi:AP2-associated protein kinase 1-like [Physeter macrocephalus]|uniref:AP2-associated protein kinase 1-like n=1 Tax=Physeter macrocephalus TaxID=9755 RepID=A0A455BXT4_PHYMC|nr:AP2-associated protein kinase 1-like [Physeter catodon]|eukprot:XP_028353825.1 mucin-2-like [Physeter catodon]